MTDKDEAFHDWFLSPMRLPLEQPYSGDVRTGFDAGWKAARDHYAPKLTEKEVVEKAAYAIAETRYPGYGSMAKWVEVNAHRYEAEAKAALRAAGLRFKEEA